MNETEALEHVTEVTVSHTEKKQLDQYEPIEAYAGYTAKVPDGVDARELRETLAEVAKEDAHEQAMARWEEYIRQDMEDD